MFPPMDPPPSGSAAMHARFSSQRTSRTKPELQLRSRLHARGLRFRVEYAITGLPRRRADIAFPRAKLAVMVDGCFWHGCPEHCVTPKTNTSFWLDKFEANRIRDRDTDARLRELGWTSLRIWEHVPPGEAADLVEQTYRRLV
ncbi:very short patch repair endonuclease [Janibacter anophelis]|uniref:very short patch repair endonuclease n=1 Tax=Janibacter anophelis TaxID=319054 RepID=UPI003F7FCA6C